MKESGSKSKRGLFPACAAVIAALLPCLACAAAAQAGAPPSAEVVLLRGNTPPEKNPEYRKVLKASRDPRLLEKAKILYLISQIRLSSYRFERNGIVYSARMAASHLMMKYSAVKERVRTAEEFVLYLGTGSNKTGQPYFLLGEAGEKHLARVVLLNELRVLEEKLGEDSRSAQKGILQGDRGPQPPAPPPLYGSGRG